MQTPLVFDGPTTPKPIVRNGVYAPNPHVPDRPNGLSCIFGALSLSTTRPWDLFYRRFRVLCLRRDLRRLGPVGPTPSRRRMLPTRAPRTRPGPRAAAPVTGRPRGVAGPTGGARGVWVFEALLTPSGPPVLRRGSRVVDTNRRGSGVATTFTAASTADVAFLADTTTNPAAAGSLYEPTSDTTAFVVLELRARASVGASVPAKATSREGRGAGRPRRRGRGTD